MTAGKKLARWVWLILAAAIFAPAAVADSAGAVWPEAGNKTKSSGKLVVDSTHM